MTMQTLAAPIQHPGQHDAIWQVHYSSQFRRHHEHVSILVNDSVWNITAWDSMPVWQCVCDVEHYMPGCVTIRPSVSLCASSFVSILSPAAEQALKQQSCHKVVWHSATLLAWAKQSKHCKKPLWCLCCILTFSQASFVSTLQKMSTIKWNFCLSLEALLLMEGTWTLPFIWFQCPSDCSAVYTGDCPFYFSCHFLLL